MSLFDLAGRRSRSTDYGGGRPRRKSLGRVAVAALGVATIAATACVPPEQPAPTLKVTASSATIHYGDEIPPITATYSATPTTEATCSTEATSSSPVGVYETVCEGAALGTRTVNYVKGKITIEAAPVTVTASSATITIGDAIPTITPSYDGFKNGTTAPAVEAVCSTDATDSSPAGTYASSCSGAEADNYSFSYVDGTVEIATAVVTVTASSGTSTYGDDAPEISASYSGFQHGETAPAVPATCSSASDASSNVGTYASSCSGASDPSYTFNYVDGTVAVTPAPLNVIASSESFTAGQPVPAITASYSGLVNGDTAPATAPVCSTDATSASPAGTYTSSCSGAADPNYDISYTNGTVTVTATAAPVTVTASSASITYGDDIPAVTPTYSGFTGGQTDPATPATCSTTATANSGAGTYPTTCSGAADPNFQFTYTSGSITILPAAATVTASSGSSVYGGSVGGITAAYSGLVNGDTAPAVAPVCSTTATSTSPAGSYQTSCSGAADPNYTFSYVAGTFTVAKAPVTVTASNATFEEGTTPPAITASYSGLVNGDSAPATPATCSTNATAASTPGTYASTCSGAADPNYTFSYTDGEVTVTQASAPTPDAVGYAGYSTLSAATSVGAGSSGASLPQSTINVASVTGFTTYTSLTVQTSSGPQSVFCKGLSTTNNNFTGCSGGAGVMSTGNFVTNGSPNAFDVYTIMGGAAAVSPASLTIIQDLPAAFRGGNSTVTANATNGIVTAVTTPAATGVFSLFFGICDAGTNTYSASDPACHVGELRYGPGAVSSMGAKVQVSIASSDVFQKLSTYIAAPATVSQGDTFTIYAAAAGSSIPKYNPSSVGDATVNNASGFGIIFPIPAGMEFQSASAMGGGAVSSGKMLIQYCAASGAAPCNAPTTGNFSATTAPYIRVSLPGVTVAGGAQLTMPTIALTLKATGAPGTVANATLTEFLLNTSVNAPIVGNQTAKFDGYPVSPTQTSGTPVKAPPAILGSIQITN